MALPIIIDARNVLDPAQTRALGFVYVVHRTRDVGSARASCAYERE